MEMEAKKRRVLEDVLPLQLIREVQKWPALYSRDRPEGSNSHFRTKIWHEVAKSLIDGWDELTQPEKQIKAHECSKKWRHLYDTFRRRYKYQRREYVYAKYMTFLNPHLPEQNNAKPRAKAKKAPEPIPPPTSEPEPKRKPPAHHTMLRTSTEHIDEDEHFLLSLLPSLRKMSDDEKLTAKMEILRVIKDVRGGGGGNIANEEDALRLPSTSCVQLKLEEDNDLTSSDTELI